MRCLLSVLIVALSSAPVADLLLSARMHHLRSGVDREWAEFPEKAEGAELVLAFRCQAERGRAHAAPAASGSEAAMAGAVERKGDRAAAARRSRHDHLLAGPARHAEGGQQRAANPLHREGLRRRGDRADERSSTGRWRGAVGGHRGRLGHRGAGRTCDTQPHHGCRRAWDADLDRNRVGPTAGGTAGSGLQPHRRGSAEASGRALCHLMRDVDSSTALPRPTSSCPRARTCHGACPSGARWTRRDGRRWTRTCIRERSRSTATRPIDERMLTIAGEGIELPVSTEHNMLVDFERHARAGRRASAFHAGGRERGDHAVASVISMCFPSPATARPIDQRASDWTRAAGGHRQRGHRSSRSF